MEKTLLYALVVHRNNLDRTIIASHSVAGSPTFNLNIAFTAIDDARTSMAGTVSLDYGRYTAHVLNGEYQYACLTLRATNAISASCLARSAQEFLERLRYVYWDHFHPGNLSTDLDNSSAEDLSALMKTMMEQHNEVQLEVQNPLSRLEGQMAELHETMLLGIEKCTKHGQSIRELVQKTEELQTQTMFRRSLRISPRNSITCLVVVILGFLIMLSSSIIAILVWNEIL